MRREITHVCRLLLKKVKHLLPLLLVTTVFLFISRGLLNPSVYAGPTQLVPHQITNSNGVLNLLGPTHRKDHNSSLPLRSRTTVIQKLATEHPRDEYSNYKIRGERNAAQTRDICQKFHTLSQNIPLTVRWSKNKSLLLCPIYKVGTTFWRRVFMIEREKKYSNIVNPYLLPFDREYASSNFLWERNVTIPQYKVMFTRDPYNRLFSFYIDKMLAPNPYFWRSVGTKVALLTRQVAREKIRKICGHDITFPEFIKYVIHTLETRKNIDPHWIEMEDNCRPCEMKYDFIGKMENFNKDSIQILHRLGLTNMTSFLEKSGKESSDDDAIRDTLSQPFTFLKNYRKCMTFKEALLRAWHKLQIRGLVGNDTLDGLFKNEKVTKVNDIILRAYASRNSSTVSERKRMKNKMFQELWSHVNLTDLYKLKKLYFKDFELFGYDSMPSTLFQLHTAS